MEQYGQEKLNYYPIIDYEAGMIKMYRYGTAPNMCSPDAARKMAGNIKKVYIVAYYAKEGTLPRILPNTTSGRSKSAHPFRRPSGQP